MLILIRIHLVGGGPSDEPISTNTPNFPGGNVIVDAFPGPVWSDFQPPFPTDTCMYINLNLIKERYKLYSKNI
jgi:hypothetical protein